MYCTGRMLKYRLKWRTFMSKLNRFIVLLLVLMVALPMAIKPPGIAQAQQEPPLYHDSRNLMFRSPFGAVTTGTEVTLRLRTPAGVPESALLRVFDRDAKQESIYPMTKVLTTPEGVDFWEYKLTTPDKPTVLDY